MRCAVCGEFIDTQNPWEDWFYDEYTDDPVHGECANDEMNDAYYEYD